MTTANNIVKKFLRMKTLPHVAIKLTRMISEDKCAMEDFESVIKLDPTLVIKTLKLVNSPVYALRKKVTSISEAVVFIGMENLRNMIIVSSVKDLYSKERDSESFSRPKLWLHCASVAICNQMISERIMGEKGEDAFLCGILHDFGMIIEDQLENNLFIETCDKSLLSDENITVLEDSIIGTNHCKVGSLMTEHLKLPDQISNGILKHHNEKNELPPNNLTSITQIGEYMVNRIGYTALPKNTFKLPNNLTSHIKHNISEYKTIAMDLPEELKKAEDIYKIEVN